MKNSFTTQETKTSFLNIALLSVLFSLILNINAQSKVCWTTQSGSIGNPSIFNCSSNTTISNADTLIVRHSVTIGTSNNAIVNLSGSAFSIISLENNAILSPYGSNNELRLPPFAEINVNTGSSIVNGNNNSQGTAISVPNSSTFNFNNNTNVVCVWGTKCCVGNQAIVGPSLLTGSNPCNFFVALPVKIVNFTSLAKNNNIELKWDVTEETNFSHYEIYVSNNGGEFEFTGKVYTTNASYNLKQYAFTHNNANSGLNIYKLKLVDKSGDFQWSQSTYINTLLNATNQNVSLYPNPSHSIVNISFKDIVLENYTITVQDLQGKVVYSDNVLDANSSQISLDINTLDNGIYIIKISNEFGVISLNKFTKI